jgi:hypothetical protein
MESQLMIDRRRESFEGKERNGIEETVGGRLILC